MTTSVRRALTVLLAAAIVVVVALTAWLLLGAAGGSVLDRGVRCGSVLHPATPPRGLVTDCRTAIIDRRHDVLVAASGSAVLVVALLAVRLARPRELT